MTVIAKISRPRLPEVYHRERLLNLLDKAMERPEVWVSAPAGSGKTTLIANWLDDRKLPCLWYQIDAGDGDIATFFYYLGLAAKKAAPRHRKPLPLFTPEYLMGISTFTRRYFEKLFSRLKPPCVIVFDNYQELSADSPIHEVIRDGMGVVPPGVNVIFISRAALPPVMTALKAERRMTSLGWEEIRLTLEETAGIMSLHGDVLFNSESLYLIHEMAQGWAAGIILMIECMAVAADSHSIPVKGELVEIFDYFAAEILAKTTPEVRDFLVKTSLLQKMTVNMAKRLTGLDRSEEILSHLLRNHYFTQKHSHPEPAYQYHPLFRDFLRSQLHQLFKREEIATLTRLAAVILADAGEFGDAAGLLRDAGQWEEFIRLILGKAQSLLLQGRLQTLAELLASVPREMTEKLPWLHYWQGVCRLPYAPASSRILFEWALRLFLTQEDVVGVLLAWSGVVDSIFYEGGDFSPLDQWIEWFIERTAGDFRFPSPEVEMVVVSSLTLVLLWKRPDHPDVRKWMERAVALSNEGDAAPFGLRVQVMLNATWYYFWCGDIGKCSVLIEKSAHMAEKGTAPPLVMIMRKGIEAAVFQMQPATCGRALLAVYDGLAIAEKTGVHVFDILLYCAGFFAAFSMQEMEKVEELFRKLTRWSSECPGQINSGNTSYGSGWYYLLTGDIARARVFAEMSLNVAVSMGILFPEMLSRLLLTEILAEMGQSGQARAELKIVAEISRRTANRLLEYHSLLAEAHIDLECGDDNGAVRLLGQAFSLGRAQNIRTLLYWWRPAKMTRLCIKALEVGIEVKFVQSLAREMKLVPEKAPLALENWPWQMKIYTLGRFNLVIDGKAAAFSGKARQKPLAMLKALIALGGRDVSEERLSDLLWPDADGAAARAAFDTTLHRLRRLLDNDRAVVMSDGKITLNPLLCWVDAWAFDEICGEVEPLLKRKSADKDRSDMIRLAEKAIALYHGGFLPGDAGEPWAISKRERLRGRFINIVDRLGGLLEESGDWLEAAECYRKGLETDNLAEELYRRLMVCHQKLGKRAEALALYQRCRLTLAAVLGVAPCTETVALFKEIASQ